MEAHLPKKLSPAQRAFADKRVKFLDHQIRLLKLGKPGVAQVIKENQAELATLKMQLTLDDLVGLDLTPPSTTPEDSTP